MFQIKFRIVDDFKTLSMLTAEEFDKEYDQVLGYIQICFGEQKVGSYYHENPLREDEEGDELLDYWFDKLIRTIIIFDSGSDYVAFKEIETVNSWVEFSRKESSIAINSVRRDNTEQLDSYIISEKYPFVYSQLSDFTFSYLELKDQVLQSSERFLKEIGEINPNLCNTKIYVDLRKKLDSIKY